MDQIDPTTRKGLEPSIFGVTGRRDNQLRYRARKYILALSKLHIKLNESDVLLRVSLVTSLRFSRLNKLLDLLVPVSSTYLYAFTSGLSPCRLQGVLLLSDGISLLEVGFTLRCLQRLSLPDLATLLCSWSATDAPAVRPFRSSRTKNSSSQISCAHDG